MCDGCPVDGAVVAAESADRLFNLVHLASDSIAIEGVAALCVCSSHSIFFLPKLALPELAASTAPFLGSSFVFCSKNDDVLYVLRRM